MALTYILISSVTSLLCVTAAPFDSNGGYIYGCPFIICTNGAYTLDSRGCRTCTFPSNTGQMGGGPGGDPFHQGGAQMGFPGLDMTSGSSPTYDKPCIAGIKCDSLSCPYGYYTGPEGCQFCICAKPSDQTTITPAIYSNPCPNAPATCDLPCADGYMTGNGGCHICQCASQSGLTSTPPTMSPEDKCFAKMTECQMTHPHGFMINDECNKCVSKDEIYNASNVTLERQPKVKLPNPCIQLYDLCMIVCETGYKTGPRLCQYCACRE